MRFDLVRVGLGWDSGWDFGWDSGLWVGCGIARAARGIFHFPTEGVLSQPDPLNYIRTVDHQNWGSNWNWNEASNWNWT